MPTVPHGDAMRETMRNLRQARQFTPEAVTEDEIQELVEVARWSGSARNKQPWHFIVVDDRAILQKISEARPNVTWVADAPLAIVIVLDGENTIFEAYDEGRVTERILLAARSLGLSGGTAWFHEADTTADIRDMLGVPESAVVRQAVVIGHPITHTDHRPNANTPGRKPAEEVISRNRVGTPL